MPTKDDYLKALGQALLILIRYSLIALVIFYLFNFSSGIYQTAKNGEQAAQAINEYIAKGWLPKFPVPQKIEDNKQDEAKK